jgi:hypothetical protein
MGIITKEMLWQQFAIAIDSLGNAIKSCPDDLWETPLWADDPNQWVAPGFSQFWYLCYHTLFWLDLYLTGAEEEFLPPDPFDLVEMQEGEVLPRVYSREELIGYFEFCRQRCHDTILEMTNKQAKRICTFAWGDVPFAELMLYTMRHVQEHAAQLHMFLGQKNE